MTQAYPLHWPDNWTRTGAKVSVKAKRLPFFKTGKGLRERLNGRA